MKKNDKKQTSMKKNSKKVSSKKDKDLLFILLTILLAIITIVLVVIVVINIGTLDPDSDKVKELHNYFSTDDLSQCDGLFTYTDKLITYDDLENETRACLAYHKSNLKKAKEEVYKPSKKETTCKVNGMVFKVDEDTNECVVTKIDKNTIDSTYKKIYGKEIKDIESFKIDNFNICYLYEDNYYCGLSETYTYTIGSESTIYRVINKAVEKRNSIIIYDFYIKINNDNCYYTYTTNSQNEKCSEKYAKNSKINYKFMKKYGTKYKHIYNKAKDGTYYWVSSEPITKF